MIWTQMNKKDFLLWRWVIFNNKEFVTSFKKYNVIIIIIFFDNYNVIILLNTKAQN